MTTAKPRISPERIVGVGVWSAAMFMLGLWAGEERSAVELAPCPDYAQQKLAYSEDRLDGTRLCSYSRVYGKAVKTRGVK